MLLEIKEDSMKIKWNWFLISSTCIRKKVIYYIRVSFWVSLIPSGIAFMYKIQIKELSGVAFDANLNYNLSIV